MEFDNVPVVSERVREAGESKIAERLGVGAVLHSGTRGCSPYSPRTNVYTTVSERGARVSVHPVFRSHDGAGKYEDRGRWCTTVMVVPSDTGEYAVCEPGDTEAEELGVSKFYVRHWMAHEAEQNGQGLCPTAFTALEQAFNAAGL